eukprot:200225_1
MNSNEHIGTEFDFSYPYPPIISDDEQWSYRNTQNKWTSFNINDYDSSDPLFTPLERFSNVPNTTNNELNCTSTDTYDTFLSDADQNILTIPHQSHKKRTRIDMEYNNHSNIQTDFNI